MSRVGTGWSMAAPTRTAHTTQLCPVCRVRREAWYQAGMCATCSASCRLEFLQRLAKKVYVPIYVKSWNRVTGQDMYSEEMSLELMATL